MKRHLPLLLALIAALALMCGGTPTRAQSDEIGKLGVIWGDGLRGESSEVYFLHLASGETISLTKAQAQSVGGQQAIGRDVQVTRQNGAIMAVRLTDNPQIQNAAVTPREGTYNVANAACMFSDSNDQPKPISYYDDLLGAEFPRVGNWFEWSSQNRLHLASKSAGWGQMAGTFRQYSGGDYQLNDWREFQALADACIATQPASFFDGTQAINLMFNYSLGCCAFGSSWFPVHIDGEEVFLPITWEPPWGQVATVLTHELGHAIGAWPHSSGNRGETGLGIYVNRSDIMSDGWADCARSTDELFGCLPQGTISYHLARAGWIDEFADVNQIGLYSFSLHPLLVDMSGPEMIRVFGTNGAQNRWYTIETRCNSRDYTFDRKLPFCGMILHEILEVTDGSREEPAHVVDTDFDGDYADEGVILSAGEVFRDSQAGISICATTNYQVLIGFSWDCANPPTPKAEATLTPNAVTLATQFVQQPPAAVTVQLWRGNMKVGDINLTKVSGDANAATYTGTHSYCPVTGSYQVKGTINGVTITSTPTTFTCATTRYVYLPLTRR